MGEAEREPSLLILCFIYFYILQLAFAAKHPTEGVKIHAIPQIFC